ncbi:CvpA family protein [Megalodesulfovibrio gigas]|uniref:Putative colicin V production family protein n=1 Tax=Megalodesulfovibrio gigas (strain ATCC 19364 / DSM 1382 / NCIMB 9332 / VKM B-1759) TaxID=1121448 RepID=T2GEM5_MEGG1|nr:CvpA family protein [Megalodesulfovibrio gigas]AGW14743.1 putative colicin V production family protein [Megalodesulfovibrio gigas DSM 1382 = ATCC 19364]
MLADFSLLDCILAGLCALFLVRGLMRGLLAEVAGLAGVVLGVWAATHYQARVFDVLRDLIQSEGWARIAAYLAVFIAAYMAVGITARVLRKLLDLAFAGWLDNLGGGLAGLTKGTVLALIVFFLADTFVPQSNFVQSSRLAPHAREYAGVLKTLLVNLKDAALPYAPLPNQLPGQFSEQFSRQGNTAPGQNQTLPQRQPLPPSRPLPSTPQQQG